MFSWNRKPEGDENGMLTCELRGRHRALDSFLKQCRKKGEVFCPTADGAASTLRVTYRLVEGTFPRIRKLEILCPEPNLWACISPVSEDEQVSLQWETRADDWLLATVEDAIFRKYEMMALHRLAKEGPKAIPEDLFEIRRHRDDRFDPILAGAACDKDLASLNAEHTDPSGD